jgi:hypothetical protein
MLVFCGEFDSDLEMLSCLLFYRDLLSLSPRLLFVPVCCDSVFSSLAFESAFLFLKRVGGGGSNELFLLEPLLFEIGVNTFGFYFV